MCHCDLQLRLHAAVWLERAKQASCLGALAGWSIISSTDKTQRLRMTAKKLPFGNRIDCGSTIVTNVNLAAPPTNGTLASTKRNLGHRLVGTGPVSARWSRQRGGPLCCEIGLRGRGCCEPRPHRLGEALPACDRQDGARGAHDCRPWPPSRLGIVVDQSRRFKTPDKQHFWVCAGASFGLRLGEFGIVPWRVSVCAVASEHAITPRESQAGSR